MEKRFNFVADGLLNSEWQFNGAHFMNGLCTFWMNEWIKKELKRSNEKFVWKHNKIISIHFSSFDASLCIAINDLEWSSPEWKKKWFRDIVSVAMLNECAYCLKYCAYVIKTNGKFIEA